MGKAGYREKIIDGELYLFCTEHLDYLPLHRFSLSNYTDKHGNKAYRSCCKYCAAKRLKNNYIKKPKLKPKFKFPRL